MATIPRDIVDEIVSNSNIVDVISNFLSLTRKGNNYYSLCPFHSDKNPSFSVSPQKNIYKCFSCGESGNALNFIMKKTGKGFVESLEYLANLIGYNYDFSSYKFDPLSHFSKEDLNLFDLLDAANTFLKTQPLRFDVATKFLNKREVNNFELLNTFDIGYSKDNDLTEYLINTLHYSEKELADAGLINTDLYNYFQNRVTFAIRDNNGKVVGFSGRTLDPNVKSKYLNSPETRLFKKSKILYNYYNAKEFIRTKKEIIIVEGYFDVIALYKSNIKNAVALMGTALSDNHIAYIKNYRIKLFLDNDQAGINASLKSILALYKHGIHDIDIVINTYNKDPDEILKQYGEVKLNELLSNTKNSLDFIYDYFISKNNLDDNKDFASLQEFEKNILDFLKYLPEKFSSYITNKFFKNYDYKIEIQKQTEQNFVEEDVYNYNSQDLGVLDDSLVPVEDNYQIPNDPYINNVIPNNNNYSNQINFNNDPRRLLNNVINNNIQIKFLIYMIESQYINDRIEDSDNKNFYEKHDLYKNVYNKIQQMHQQNKDDNDDLDFLDNLDSDFQLSENVKNIISIKKEDILNDLNNIFSKLVYLENNSTQIDQSSINSFFEEYSSRIRNEVALNQTEWEINLDPLIRAFTNEFIIKNKNNMSNIKTGDIDVIRTFYSRNKKTTIKKEENKKGD
ncbi:DNA primase [Mycoplasma sp. OR1901]|uniref:DNA primase n=1 Tax=Mycoplasma sp. OR1901 TaxID=2742195 RepID=UPI00158320D4|nr:DNA primase [Mycoplasma sp. OR1901]QKT05277.1 DNA primase [Mycoplasma sp. OR1901]